MGRHGSLIGEALLAGHHELGEPTHVFDYPAAGQLQDPVGHRVDEVPVVAYEQEPGPPAGQVVLQPGHAVHVEVVGWLVENQKVRCGEQQTGQGHPHPPTTG